MKLVMIYGPPAVGKLTVAQELERTTGLVLMHNHLFSDLVLSVFERGTDTAVHLNHQIRCLVYEAAAAQGIPGIITTFTYNPELNDQIRSFIKETSDRIGRLGGSVSVVRLSCSPAELVQRVSAPSRIGTRKLTSPEKLREELRSRDLLGHVPDIPAETLHIDTSLLNPSETARRIKIHCGLE